MKERERLTCSVFAKWSMFTKHRKRNKWDCFCFRSLEIKKVLKKDATIISPYKKKTETLTILKSVVNMSVKFFYYKLHMSRICINICTYFLFIHIPCLNVKERNMNIKMS